MSKYTTEVRFICESEAGLVESTGFNAIEDILTEAAPKVFNFPFPIFDEAYRVPLEKKILRHYYTREICEETVGLWKLRLSQKLNEIMPYYNQLYESELIEFNPLYDVDYTKAGHNVTDSDTHDAGVVNSESSDNVTTHRTGTNNITNGNKRDIDYGKVDTLGIYGMETDTEVFDAYSEWEYFNDTPQGGINGLANLNYLTSAKKTDPTGNKTRDKTFTNRQNVDTLSGGDDITDAGYENTTRDLTDATGGNSTSSINTTKNVAFDSVYDYTEHISGKRNGQTFSKSLMEFRETFLNIDSMIIRELQPLFFGLWE